MREMNKIFDLIEKRQENEIVDFKLQFYAKECKSDMIKDMVSFANSCLEEDKYIIFGFDNKEYVFNDVDYDKIEDISNYVQLLNEYVEPFLNFSLEKFTYKNTKMAYIIIKKSNTNRPYVIKKEFSRKGIISLRQGEVYIRKNANNFIASRNDLDNIYDARKQIKINLQNVMQQVLFKNGIEKKYLWGLQVSIINNTNLNLSINSGKLLIKTKTNNIEIKILYIENCSEIYGASAKLIKDAPFNVPNLTNSVT